MENPLVSVIVPVYNAAAFLPAAVESILAQTYTSWELILIDDGSTDASPAICDTYADANPRIRVIHQPNAGVSAARNAGLRHADGEFISFVDADDLVAPEYLQHLVTQQQRTQADLVGTWREFVDANLTPIPRKPTAIDACYTADGFQILLDKAPDFFTVVWGKLYRKSLIDKHQITFSELLSRGEDILFLYCFVSVCHKIASDSKKLYFYRKYSSSLSKTNKSSVIEQLLIRHDELIRFADAQHIEAPHIAKISNNICFDIVANSIRSELSFAQMRQNFTYLHGHRHFLQLCLHKETKLPTLHKIIIYCILYKPTNKLALCVIYLLRTLQRKCRI